jgi:hypothetical protein
MKRIVATTAIFFAAGISLCVLEAISPPNPANRLSRQTTSRIPTDRVSTPSRATSSASGDKPSAIVSASVKRAEHGDAQAMRRIADSLRRCAEVPRLSNDALAERQIDISLKDEAILRDSGIAVDPAAQAARVQARIDEQESVREACASVSPAQSSTWIAWLQRAADAGDRGAEREYVDVAYAEFRDGVPADRLEEAVQRRDTVRRYAEDLLTGGDCAALEPLQWSVSQPLDAFRYHVAYVELTRRRALAQGADPASLSPLDTFLADRGTVLSESEREAAEASAEALLRRSCPQ